MHDVRPRDRDHNRHPPAPRRKQQAPTKTTSKHCKPVSLHPPGQKGRTRVLFRVESPFRINWAMPGALIPRLEEVRASDDLRSEKKQVRSRGNKHGYRWRPPYHTQERTQRCATRLRVRTVIHQEISRRSRTFPYMFTQTSRRIARESEIIEDE